MRKKLIAGNWKMNNTLSQAENFVEEIKSRINIEQVDVVICPNNIVLEKVSDLIEGTKILLGAQNVYYEDKGAFTGEVSADMLLSVGVKYCIIGHSERRQMFGETNESVNRKAKKLLEKDIIPIVCVGETKEQRDTKKHFEVISLQLKKALDGIDAKYIKKKVVIAYEPIWAIGTGITATTAEAEEMCKFIRNEIAGIYEGNVADNIKILYGGSVKPSNTKELLEQEDIDGALVGGASLTNDFVAIVNY
ncbi:MAG: triose-phosphate isomerase [Clostridia bacterium]